MSNWAGNRLLQDRRWQYGIPPINNANYAWIQHIIYHLASNGLAAFTLSNGSLNHGQTEGKFANKLSKLI